MISPPNVTVFLVAAGTLREAVDAALTEVGTDGNLSHLSPAVIAAANGLTARERGLARVIQARLSQTDVDSRVVVAPDFSAALWGRVARRASQWTAIDLGQRGERVSSVVMSSAIVGAGALICVNDVRGESGERPAIAIGIWSRFAGLRERIGARASTPEQGLAAEIALAVQPGLIVLADSWRGGPIVVATSDQVAAELVGLAIRHAIRGSDEERVGPWQDALVQRATDLGLGVRVPDQIAIRASCMGGEGTAFGAEFARFIAELAARLGVGDFAVQNVKSSTTRPPNLGNTSGWLL